MLSFAAGEYWSDRAGDWIFGLPIQHTTTLVRTSACLPALLVLSRGPVGLVVWLAVGGCGVVAGVMEGHDRQIRRQATAPLRWSPASAVTLGGNAVLRVTGWPRPGTEDRWSAPAIVLAWAPADSSATVANPVSIGMGILVSGRGPPPAPGSVLAGQLTLRVPPDAPLPGSFDYRRYLAGRCLVWQGRLATYRLLKGGGLVAGLGQKVLAPVRRSIMSSLAEYLPDREADLTAAVLLGARTPASRTMAAPFTALGLAHLFAVSGLHVGILLGIVLLPGRWLGASPRVAAVVFWFFVPLYLLLTGLPGSVVRAGGMGLLAAQAQPVGRRVDALRLLGLLYWAGSILVPLQDLDAGLQLSYMAAGGILLVSRVTNGLRFSGRRWLQPVLAGLGVSFAAQWFTLPLIAASFGQLSLLSPLANLFVVPLFGLAVWAVVLALVCGLFYPPAAGSLAAVGWLLLRIIAGVVAWVGQQTGGLPCGLPVPGPWQILAWLGLTVVLLAGLRFRSRLGSRWWTEVGIWLVLPLVLVQLLGPQARNLPTDHNVIAWQFDVGQGDCGLLVFPDGWTAIIDTAGRFGHEAGPSDGPLGRTVLPFLRRQGYRRLDAVLLTHGHADHTGGAIALAREISVAKWYVSGRAAEALACQVDSLQIRHPVAGTILHRWQEWSLAIEYPAPGQKTAPSENNWSLVSVLRQNGRARMVWSGDLELAGEAALLAAAPDLAEVEVWKAGHHGSNTSGSQALLSLLRPQLILVSCGVENSYHHPSHGPYVVQGDTLPVLRTDLDGSIRLNWAENGTLNWQTDQTQGEIRGGAP